MADELVIIPAPRSAEGYVELSRTRLGKLYRKHILNLGELKYEGKTYKLDDDWYARLKDNFNSGVADIVQVPLANDANQHSEDPSRNLGEVVDIERQGNKVYAVIDARKQADDFGKTLLGASAFLHMNYTDTSTQKRVGPALLHVAVTNRPYITKLEPYQEIVAASADGTGEVLVLASEEEPVSMTREELLAALKAEHGIDVEALQSQAAQRTDAAALTAAITSALQDTGTVKLTGDGLDAETISGAIVELANDNKGLRESVTRLERNAAETEVDGYIAAGRLLPKTKATAVELALSNRDALDAILAPADQPYVRLAHQEGAPAPDGEEKHNMNIDDEIARLTNEHSQVFEQHGQRGSVRK